MISLQVNALVVLGFWFLLLTQWPKLAGHFRSVRQTTWIALLALALINLLLIKPLIPHSVIFSNNHGIELMAMLRDSSVLEQRPVFAFTYGNLHFTTIGLLHELSGRQVSVFTLNYLQATGSALLLFLLAFLMLRSQRAALLAALMMFLLPVRLRLGATESLFVTAEFYLILTLLLCQLYVLSEDPAFAGLAVIATFLLTEARVEMMLLAPVIVISFFLVQHPAKLRAMAKSPRVWLAVVASTLAFMPRWLEIFGATGKNEMYGKALGIWQTFGYPLSVFFHRDYTPLAVMLLFGLGCVVLALRGRRLFVWLSLTWLVSCWVFAHYYFTLSCFLRRSLPVHFAFVLIAAAGANFLVRRLRGRGRAGQVLALSLPLLLVANAALHRSFLTRRYTMQQEFGFLQIVHRRLPADSTLVLFDRKDVEVPGVRGRLYPDYQAKFLRGRRPGRRIVSIGEFLARPRRYQGSQTYFYLGAICYKLPRHLPKDRRQARPDYLHPKCRQVLDAVPHETLLQARISPPGLSFPRDVIEGRERLIALYRLRPPAAP